MYAAYVTAFNMAYHRRTRAYSAFVDYRTFVTEFCHRHIEQYPIVLQLAYENLPRRLEKPVRNGGRLEWARFTAVHGTPAAEGTPFGLRIDGVLSAIAERHESTVKVRTWLGE